MCNLLKIRCVYGASRKNFRLKNLVSTNFGSNFALAKTKKPTTNKTYNYETYVYYCSASCYGSGGV